jgi:hypothetical membrane protein
VTRAGLASAGLALVASGVQFVVAEALTAAAWDDPAYDYVRYFISDLGSPECGPFQGREVCSPRHGLMNAAFVAQGVLFAAGGTVLARSFEGRTRRVLQGLVGAQAAGVVLVGVCPSSPAAVADGRAALHGLGAALAIVAGNASGVVAGRAWWRGGRRRLGAAGAALGATGLLGAAVMVATWERVPPGGPERLAVYPFQAWQVLAGAALLGPMQRGSSRNRRSGWQ